MKKNKTYIGLILLAAGLLAGCSGSEGGEDVVPQNTHVGQQAELRLTANNMPTRATTIDDNTDLQSYNLKIDAYYHNTETKFLNGKRLRYNASAWKFWSDGEPGEQEHYYWPIEGSVYTAGPLTVSSLDFVGFCPYTKPEYIGTPTYNHSTGVRFTCDMSGYMTLDDQEDMDEFIVSVLPNQTLATQTAAGGALPMVFKHPFALIKFTITAASGTHVQINSIKLTGLKTGGTCTYNGTTMAWSDLTGSADMTLTQTLKNGGTTEGTPFVVIPNNYGSKFLTVNATWDDWSDVTISDYGTDVDFNWEAGRIYTYNLTLDKYALKVDIVEKFTEQW